MSSDRCRRQIKTRGNDAQRLNALEELKRARQGGQGVIAEQPPVTNEPEEEEEDDEQYESDSENYEDIKPSTKRKSSNSHHKDSKRLKKKQHYSDNEDDDDDDQQTKSSEPKRRAQTFAKPQEESTGMHDIKSMFAANKTRVVQRQEQSEKDESDKLLSDIMFELQKPKLKPTHPAPQSLPPPPPPIQPAKKIEVKPVEVPRSEESKPVYNPEPSVQQGKELDWGDDDSMSFDAVSKLMNDTAPPPKPLSPPRVSKSLIQFDTQELEFV
ncbi:unnamed protein product, partial [Adineta steineri]